jgi:hypothetical protein
MSVLAGRMILNEILNSDYRDLHERIEKNPAASSLLGLCGESPAHIAIYKRDQKMLIMLLKAGTDPKLANNEGNTLVHVAAQLGYFECVQTLYETGKCELILKNNEGQTALNIANSKPDKATLHVLKSFAEYRCGEPEEKAQILAITEGRKQCAAYLAEKMVYDREQKVRNMVQSTLDANNDRRNKARILRGVGGTKYTSFYSDLSYHTDINKPPWEKIDMDFFVKHHEGIDHIVRVIFACDYINKSIRVGTHNALLRMQVKMASSTYPVRTADARIPGVEVAASAVASAVRTGLPLLQRSATTSAIAGAGGGETIVQPGAGDTAGAAAFAATAAPTRKEVFARGSLLRQGSGRSALVGSRGGKESVLPAVSSTKSPPPAPRMSTSPHRQSSMPVLGAHVQPRTAPAGDGRRNLLARSPSGVNRKPATPS